MNAYRIGVTLSLKGSDEFDLHRAVPVFHKWIQGQSLPGHLLIDVADYMHVEDGPGVVLVSHEATIGLERKPGQCELVYLRKRPFGTTFSDRIATVLESALAAARLLQNELPSVRFATERLRLRLVDKLNAPNDADTLRRILPDLENVFGKVFDHSIRVEHNPDPLKHFEVTVETGTSLALADLLQRVSVTSG